MSMAELTMPAAPDVERLVLGAVMLDDSLYPTVAGALTTDCFTDQANRRIFGYMAEIHDGGGRIDRITLMDALRSANELESIGGLAYLCSLDDGMPRMPTVDGYVDIVRKKAEYRRIMLVCDRLMARASAELEAPDDLLSEMAAAAIDSGERNGDAQTVGQIITEAGGMDAYMRRPQAGLLTGIHEFDRLTEGLHGGDLFILAARPSMGKTALALNVAANVAIRDKHVGVFSLEMSKKQLIDRLMASAARVNSQWVRRGSLNPENRERVTSAMPPLWDTIHIQDKSNCSGLDIHGECRRIKARTGLALVIVDYLQLMVGDGRNDNRNAELSKISRGLKLMAKDLDIPVMALSQLSRGVETRQEGDHKPRLSDLRDSGAIEQDADLVAFIYRPIVYKPERQDLAGQDELILAKQRNGPTGMIPVTFRKEFVRFDERVLNGGEERDGQS